MMDLAVALDTEASRLGLQLDWDGFRLHIRRKGWLVLFNPGDSFGTVDAPLPSTLAWLLLGIRLGLDKRAGSSSPPPQKPLHLRYRRTPLRRYHEAPSVHGEYLPLLLSDIARQAMERVSACTAFARTWLIDGLSIVFFRAVGKRRDILTTDEQAASSLSDPQRWQNTRNALFYDTYKLKPHRNVHIDGGTLRIFLTVDGLGASRGLLLPEFDYDAAQDGGFLAIPTGDSFIIARPESPQKASRMLPFLRTEIQKIQAKSTFHLSDAIFQLHRQDLSILEKPSLDLHSPARILTAGIEEVRSPA